MELNGTWECVFVSIKHSQLSPGDITHTIWDYYKKNECGNGFDISDRIKRIFDLNPVQMCIYFGNIYSIGIDFDAVSGKINKIGNSIITYMNISTSKSKNPNIKHMTNIGKCNNGIILQSYTLIFNELKNPEYNKNGLEKFSIIGFRTFDNSLVEYRWERVF